MTEPYWSDTQIALHLGDCVEVLAGMDDASVDAVVTDPPYGLEFMGREWDSFKPSQARIRSRVDARTNPAEGKSVTVTPESYTAGQPFQAWCEKWAAECLRVLKPGGHLLAFGGTRTYHRLACGIEDAGFEIRDSLHWIYGSGFPKSLDVSKAIDKMAPRHEMLGPFADHYGERRHAAGLTHAAVCSAIGAHGDVNHGGASVNWERGYGVPTPSQWRALAPLLQLSAEWLPLIERIEAEREVVGTKAMGRLAVAPGQGADRSAVSLDITAPATDTAAQWEGWGTALKPAHEPIIAARKPLAGTVAQNVLANGTGALNVDGCRVDAGRWPPNVLLGPEAAAELDRQSGVLTAGANPARRGSDQFRDAYGEFAGQAECTPQRGADSGGASRFFPVFRYEAKAAAHERPRGEDGTAHPTVKPVDLMRWLVRLVTPPGGLVCDPFAGSGTTGEACIVEGFRCVLIEKDPGSVELIQARLRKPIQPDMFGGLAS